MVVLCPDTANISMGTLNIQMLFLLVACLLATARGFLPRTNLASGKSTTLDHALITKEGFLKPLLYFLRQNPQYLKDGYVTDFLYDIFKSNAPLQDTIASISPQIKFLNALNEIQSANVEVDSFPLRNSAAAHFDGEQIRQGSQRIIQLRQELVTSLLKGDKLQHARNLAGRALHTLQDFYSHSNWIELGNRKPYDVLGKPGSEIPQDFIAGPREATCTNCPLEQGSGLPNGSCETNLDTVKLTSGYRSGQDIKKPKNLGKCSHGGKMDESRLEPATGGINKDSTSRDESPHAR